MAHLSERGQKVNLMDIPVGTAIHVKTGNSNWYFCRVEGSILDKYDYIHGVMIVTDSKAWGRITDGPFRNAIFTEIRIGDVIGVKTGDDFNNTGDVRSITWQS